MSEDLSPSGDITTNLIRNNKKIKAKIISNQNCIVGGLDLARFLGENAIEPRLGELFLLANQYTSFSSE